MIAITLLSAISFLLSWSRRVLAPAERLGKGFLFVYWIHVELVYGCASWSLRQKLDLAQTAIVL